MGHVMSHNWPNGLCHVPLGVSQFTLSADRNGGTLLSRQHVMYYLLATHWQHISNTLATHHQLRAPYHVLYYLSATHWQHISNTLATHSADRNGGTPTNLALPLARFCILALRQHVSGLWPLLSTFPGFGHNTETQKSAKRGCSTFPAGCSTFLCYGPPLALFWGLAPLPCSPVSTFLCSGCTQAIFAQIYCTVYTEVIFLCLAPFQAIFAERRLVQLRQHVLGAYPKLTTKSKLN